MSCFSLQSVMQCRVFTYSVAFLFCMSLFAFVNVFTELNGRVKIMSTSRSPSVYAGLRRFGGTKEQYHSDIIMLSKSHHFNSPPFLLQYKEAD